MKYASMSAEYVDHMGSDLSVVNAARVSFAKVSEKLTEKDEKLISYLATHDHWSPFAHCFLSLRIKTPIFVARQLVKHQIGLSWNEVSRRYVSDEPEFYVPTSWRGAPTDGAKQGSTGEIANQGTVDILLTQSIKDANNTYLALLAANVAPEQARMILPQNIMTEWIWSGSLMAFARVCNLRLDPHAQSETRQIAARIDAICEDYFPISWKALRR